MPASGRSLRRAPLAVDLEGVRPGSADRGRDPVDARRQGRVPPADGARVPKRRAGEVQGEGVRVALRADVVPIEDELAEVVVPVRRPGVEVAVGEVIRRRECIREERGASVSVVPRPPADLDLLGVSRVPQGDARAQRF
jgi:hypothetical protein